MRANVGEIPRLKKEQLNSLISICPLVMDWLRSTTDNAADLFQQSYEEDYDRVACALAELVEQLNEDPNSSFWKLSSLFQKYRVSVWANSLRLIITQSNPMIVPPEVGSDIVGTIPQLNGAMTINEVCHILGPLLDKLPRSSFVALGEFCALLRDTGSSATFLACLIGPQLLLPNLLITSPSKQGPAALAAAAVFELLITESESLFGRAAARRVANPFGEFVTESMERFQAAMDFVWAARDPDLQVAKQALRAFYDWRDPVKSSNTDRLFRRLSIFAIAEGIQKKYGVIPPGWGILLKELSKIQIKRVLQPRPPTGPPPVSLLPVSVNFNAELNKARGAEIERNHSSSNFKESKEMQMVIKEMCDSEGRYYNALNTFINTYCEKLQAIINGMEGDKHNAKSLGVNKQDIETLFGQKLVNCKDVSQEFCARLAVLTDFEDPDTDSRGKLGLLLDAFDEVFPKLIVLEPYMENYLKCVTLINNRSQELRKKRKKKKKKMQTANFLQLWELERVKHENLKLSSLENILIKPVQRIPQYKVLLKELLSHAKKESHPAIANIKEMLEKIEGLGHSIDKKIDNPNATRA